jgi:hypothetical protein
MLSPLYCLRVGGNLGTYTSSTTLCRKKTLPVAAHTAHMCGYSDAMFSVSRVS